jgi:two-component system LytT family response regulator
MLSERIPVIVVDDEKPSRVALTTYINDYCPELKIVAECDAVKSAYQAIITHKPQIVFLDIEMPNGNGFDLLQLFKILPFKVIFVTAYSEYAIRAFRFAATDYLLKPVKIDELVEAVDRARNELNRNSENLNFLLDLIGNHHGEFNKLVIRDTKGVTVIKINELIMCEADGYCTQFYLTGGRKIMSGKNLGYYEEIFNKGQMIKVHRSFMVNPAFVNGYTKLGEIVLEEKLTCPLGSNYKSEFFKSIDLH